MTYYMVCVHIYIYTVCIPSTRKQAHPIRLPVVQTNVPPPSRRSNDQQGQGPVTNGVFWMPSKSFFLPIGLIDRIRLPNIKVGQEMSCWVGKAPLVFVFSNLLQVQVSAFPWSPSCFLKQTFLSCSLERGSVADLR